MTKHPAGHGQDRVTASDAESASRPARRAPAGRRAGGSHASSGIGLGIRMLWFSLLVLIPLTAVVVQATDGGWTRLLGHPHQRADRGGHPAHRRQAFAASLW